MILKFLHNVKTRKSLYPSQCKQQTNCHLVMQCQPDHIYIVNECQRQPEWWIDNTTNRLVNSLCRPTKFLAPNLVNILLGFQFKFFDLMHN